MPERGACGARNQGRSRRRTCVTQSDTGDGRSFIAYGRDEGWNLQDGLGTEHAFIKSSGASTVKMPDG